MTEFYLPALQTAIVTGGLLVALVALADTFEAWIRQITRH